MSQQLVDHWVDHMTTAAAGSMLGPVPRFVLCVGIALAPGTASGKGITGHEYPLTSHASTNSGIREQETQSSSAAMMELRRVSGLTWDQLARLFRTSRRSLHFWVSGKPLNAAHEERLHRLLATIRQIDRGSATENRVFLFSVQQDGMTPFEFLVEGQYDQALAALCGPGGAQARSQPATLAAAARSARTPPPPDFFAGALQDRAHTEVGKSWTPRVARSQP